MARSGVWPALIGAALIWAGVAFAAPAASPPSGAFKGEYTVTVHVTNAKMKPTHWIYGTHPNCAGPCHAVTFRIRSVAEKSWRSSLLVFHWKTNAYTRVQKLPKNSDCVGKSGATVKKGYDVTSSSKFQVRATTNGRVKRWSGTGRDDYVPNAAGRAKHCKAGAYLYTLSALAQ